MTDRITDSHLKAVCYRINRVMNAPLDPYTKHEDGRFAANIGNYHLSYDYGGVSLYRMLGDAGGVSDVFGCGHVTKRDLAERMHAFLAGISAARGES